jgi:hypothetical protein
MSLASYFSSLYTLLGLAGLAGACLFTWWKGGPPERMGVLVVVAVWIGSDLVRAVGGQMIAPVTLLVSDFAAAAGFLYIAVRYSSLWLGAAMMFQAMSLALHAMQLSENDAPRWHGWIIYLLIVNVLSYLILLALIGGAVSAIFRRRRLAREKAQAEAKAEAKAARPASPFRAPPQPPATAF